ncbi:unnamed protein product, partial [Musa textilis]
PVLAGGAIVTCERNARRRCSAGSSSTLPPQAALPPTGITPAGGCKCCLPSRGRWRSPLRVPPAPCKQGACIGSLQALPTWRPTPATDGPY